MDKKPWLTVTSNDCKWDYFRVGGNGGQKVNKTMVQFMYESLFYS